MTTRKLASLPLLIVGGLIIIAANLAAVAATIYYTYLGLRDLLNGDIESGLATRFVTVTVAGFVISLLAIPGAALWVLGEKVRGEGHL